MTQHILINPNIFINQTTAAIIFLFTRNGVGSLIKKRSLRMIFPRAFHYILKHFLQFINTTISRLYAHWWGIRIGKKSIFYGIPILYNTTSGGINIGDHCTFTSTQKVNFNSNRRCVITAYQNAKIDIGNNCGFSSTVILAHKSITIGNRVISCANCTIMDSDGHSVDFENRHIDDSSPIIINDDVWLGFNVTVLKGCTIGARTVVTANSTVAHSLPADVIAGGVPARVIKRLNGNSPESEKPS